jgi:hypothetical protein
VPSSPQASYNNFTASPDGVAHNADPGRVREEAGMPNNPGDPYGHYQQQAAIAHRVSQQAHAEQQAGAAYATRQAAADGNGPSQYVAPGVSPAIKWLVVLGVISVLTIFALVCAGLVYTAAFGNFR